MRAKSRRIRPLPIRTGHRTRRTQVTASLGVQVAYSTEGCIVRDFYEVRAELDRAKADQRRLTDESDQIRGRLTAGADSSGLRERLHNLEAGVEQRDLQVAELEGECGQAMLDGLERGQFAGEGEPEPQAATADGDPRRRADRDSALRTIERYTGSGELRGEAADRLDHLIRRRDTTGIDARYLAAVGDAAYNSAFGKILRYGDSAQLRFSKEETAAVMKTNAVEQERGLVSGVGAQGGFAIPFTLDPSILLTSSGALNPIRALSRVIQVATREWKGVSSAGVTASYDAEASEVSDDTPTLAQPTITTAMGRAFIPYSVELGEDWASLQQELGQLVADARDVLDAGKFYDGSGTDEPAGVLTGLSTAQRVQTAGAGAFAVGDVYLLKQALPPRWMTNGTFAFHPNRVDAIYRFTPAGSTTEPQALPTRDGPLVGRPVAEWTALTASGVTTGTKLGFYGDFNAAFTIADRVGMTAEIVAHLFGASRRPTGERGLFAHWRTGSKVVNPSALRYLEVA